MKKSKILEEEKMLNEKFSMTPVTEEQKRVAEKYKNEMDLRFTPDGQSWSIWHDGQFHFIGIVSKIEQDVTGNKINCLIDGDKVTLFTKPQNEEQEIIFKNYQYLKKPIYFYDCKGLLPCIINKNNELEQLLRTSFSEIPLYLNCEDSAIVQFQEYSYFACIAPFSYEQQRIYSEIDHHYSKIFFSADGKKIFIYTSDKKICELVEEKEVNKIGLDEDKYCDFGNGYIIIEIDESEKHFKNIKQIVEPKNSQNSDLFI